MLRLLQTSTSRWPEKARWPAPIGCAALPQGPRLRQALQRTLASLCRPDVADRTERVPLDALDAEDRSALSHWLGCGDTRMTVEGQPPTQACDTRFAGVWWVWQTPSQTPGEAWLEVGLLPRALRAPSAGEGLDLARHPAQHPARHPARYLARSPARRPGGEAGGTGVTAVLTAIAQAQRRWRSGQPNKVLNLSLAPLDTPQRGELDTCIGLGPVRMSLQGPGVCEISSTALSRVWRVRHLDALSRCGLDLLEIGAIPERALPGPGDLDDAAASLRDLLAWMQQQGT